MEITGKIKFIDETKPQKNGFRKERLSLQLKNNILSTLKLNLFKKSVML